jgi:hypothetical protein
VTTPVTLWLVIDSPFFTTTLVGVVCAAVEPSKNPIVMVPSYFVSAPAL